MVRTSAGERTTGWEAIHRAMARRYGPGEPLQVGEMRPMELGGDVQGISAYRTPDDWHLVTFSLTELWDKQTDDPGWSGYGFEFTLRLPADTDAPPAWAASVLSFMCRYVRTADRLLHDGHFLLLPECADQDGWSRPWPAAAFVIDPDLGGIATPNGRVEFLQAVGIDHEAVEELTGPPPFPGADLPTRVREHAARCHDGDPRYLSPALLSV